MACQYVIWVRLQTRVTETNIKQKHIQAKLRHTPTQRLVTNNQGIVPSFIIDILTDTHTTKREETTNIFSSITVQQ